MTVSSPIRDVANKPIAALAFRLDPRGDFTQTTRLSRFGESGETYAFDRNGRLLTGSRFEDTPAMLNPLTRIARSGTKGESGVDLDGYPDYRGVPVVGAWLWDEQLGMGLATEMDVSEAYAPSIRIRNL